MAKTVDPTPQDPAREERPKNPAALKAWIRDYTGLKIPDRAVCTDHHSPWECFGAIHQGRPSIALILGARGSGKSFLSALDTHLTSRWDPGHGTRILGGSKAQSAQIYAALREIALHHEGDKGDDGASIARLRKDGATYANGSEVEILAASSTSVRGPHVPSLKLDEVDEMDTDIRESAMGMCLGRRQQKGRKARGGMNASVLMTSTCHRANGPMAGLIERAGQGDFPLYTMCVFEVLEKCPDSRSGKFLERCPDCPLFRHCHDVPDGWKPKAKRSAGHYPIESLIQKIRATGSRTFEADYLCRFSSTEAAWFPDFRPETHVGDRAEYRAGTDVHLAVDTGVFTGAVFFQVVEVAGSEGKKVDEVHVFADYLAENRTAEANARAIKGLAGTHCEGKATKATTDPAGHSRTGHGVTVLAEYFRGGLPLEAWPIGRVDDGLALLDSFVSPADGVPRLLIHPRCQDTIRAFQGYRRAKRAGQWLDRPADPQHPHEDLIDALRGGLKAHYPRGRIAPSNMKRVQASKVL